MMEVMLAKKKPMSELAAPLKIYPQVLENVRVTDKKAAQNDPAVQEAVSKVRLGTFQLSDIFYNTVGGVLGGLMCCVVMKARKRL